MLRKSIPCMATGLLFSRSVPVYGRIHLPGMATGMARVDLLDRDLLSGYRRHLAVGRSPRGPERNSVAISLL
jgi:hypothetical protein